jgi:uncharacterized protein YkwD/putative cell wall-binding protein
MRTWVKNTTGAVLALALVLGGCAAGASALEPPRAPLTAGESLAGADDPAPLRAPESEARVAAAAVPLDQAVARILNDTNAARQQAGLAPLTLNSAVTAVAQNWSEQQFAAGSMAHNPSYAQQIPAGWSSAGENAAYGYTVEQVTPAWLNSPAHRANILNPAFTDIGIGYVDRDGRRYFTQNFAGYPRTSDRIARIDGTDRFAVSASISAATFRQPGVAVAYVASGENFPDALSGSAAAGAEGGPVLLVTRDSVPAAVGAELDRLDPRRIAVLGGTASVSAAVQTALGAYSGTIERIAGADRFAVSAAVSASVFDPGVPVAYIASGLVFPDALSGSAAAGAAGAPVLLVSRDTIPGPVLVELQRLKPGRIVVLGGSTTVSDGVAQSLGAVATTTRIGGADRFEVSAAIARQAFLQSGGTVYVASGQTFPDALSGSAAAIRSGSPVLLVTGSQVPAPIAAEVKRLKPARIVILGGENSVSRAVAQQLDALSPR